MSVVEYKNEKGQTQWKAYASVKSKIKPAIRVQKWKFNLKTRKQAEREEMNLVKECQAEVLRREAQGETWGSIVDSWELFIAGGTAGMNEDTRSDNVAALRLQTFSWLRRPAREITRADVMEVLAQMKGQGYSISNQRRVKAAMNSAFNYGIDHRMITGLDRSPAFGISLGKEEEKKPEILNIEEMRELLRRAKIFNHPWYPVWTVALHTGMRNGELYALLWSDVDFENREISLVRSYNCRRRKIVPTKAKYWRTIPISDELDSFLKKLKAESGDRAELLPRLPGWYRGCQALVLREFCVGAKLPSIKFHTLRACFATQLIRNGVPPIQVQKICGWRDLETMQRYIRLAGIDIKGATESLQVLPEVEVLGLMDQRLAEQERVGS